ncbi:MAG: sugar phosphate isomerase/epimerase [Clostridia bacterium]|nr:sugar phosphate isomerase/epimerase [Clostridia bacterium]
MNIVTTTSVFPFDYPCDKALLRLSALGFKHLDLAMDYCSADKNCPFGTDGWEAWANGLRELAEKNGGRYTHSHAQGDAIARPKDPLVLRCLDICRILDTGYCVIHPVWKGEDGHSIKDVEQFVKINAEAIKPFLEHAEKNGVILLSENLLWGASILPTAISALVEEVNSPYFGWCYDTGHANAFGHPVTTLLDCSVAPLSLHIQDNHGEKKDEHLLPGDGTLDWKLFLETLHQVGYKGEMVLEAHHQSLDAPDGQRDGILTDLLSRAQKMRDYYLKLQ